MFNWIHYLLPPKQWRIPVIFVLGILTGLFIYIFHVSKASSYLSEDPKTCINCHVMIPQYATWKRSSHREVATCMDCHVPHDNIFHKYVFKMKDGMRHAKIFTLRQEPQVIQIKEEGAAAVQSNCIRCHENVLKDVSIYHATYKEVEENNAKLCWDCHREVPHGKVRSLSATPYARVPQDQSMIPEWLREFIPIIEKSNQGGQDEKNR